MKDIVKRAAGGMTSALEHYRKLSRWERFLCWGGIGAVTLLGMVIAGLGGDEAWRVVARAEPNGDGSRLEALGAELKLQRIRWREGRAGDGARTIEVVGGADPGAVLEAVGRSKTSSTALDSAWIDQSAGLFEPPERFAQRLTEHNRRRVEQSIRLNDKIQEVSLTIAPPPRTSFVRRPDDRGSAAVAIRLRSGAELSRGEAEAIRDHVRCAFGLRPEDVAITDWSNGQLVSPRADAAGGGLEEKERRTREQVVAELRTFYRPTFGEDELSLSVLVTLSAERQSIEKKEMDREKSFILETESEVERGGETGLGGVLAAGMKPVTLTETIKSTPYESYQVLQIDIPPGELKAVSVIAHFDLQAVLRGETALAESGASAPGSTPHERGALVKAFVELQEQRLQSFLGVFKTVNVAVLVRPFQRAGRESPVAIAGVAGESPPGPDLGLADGVGRSPWASVVALGAVLSAVLVLWVAIARRRRPRLPSHLRADGLRRREERPGLPRFAPEDGLLDSVGRLSSRVRERPDVAASILRVWLHQDAEELPEEALRP